MDSMYSEYRYFRATSISLIEELFKNLEKRKILPQIIDFIQYYPNASTCKTFELPKFPENAHDHVSPCSILSIKHRHRLYSYVLAFTFEYSIKH